MTARWKHIGNLRNISYDKWQTTSNQYNDKFIILTKTNDIYICKSKDDIEGQIKTIDEILELILQETTQQQSNISVLKEKALQDETHHVSHLEIISIQQQIHVPTFAQSTDSLLSISSSSFDPLLASKLKRQDYLKVFNHHPWLTEFQKFEQDLDSLLQKPVKETIEIFVKTYEQKYTLSTTDFESLFVDPSKAGPYIREKILNIAFNTHKNAQEIRDFIETKKESIISDFAPEQFQKIPKDNFQVKIEVKAGETHNQGKLPAKITFFLDTKEAFSVMYKPRAAELDRSVQELLAKCQLPSYRINSYKEENKSIWTYIDGQNMLLSGPERRNLGRTGDPKLKGEGPLRTPEAFLKYSESIDPNKRPELLGQLNKLNGVLSAIHITDLHGENIRLGKDGKMYPIDLEVMDHRQPTLLMIDDYHDKVETT